jgi:hypothetical protein
LGLANLANIEVHYHQCLLNSNFCGFLLFWVRFTWIRIFKGRVLISTQGKRIWCIYERNLYTFYTLPGVIGKHASYTVYVYIWQSATWLCIQFGWLEDASEWHGRRFDSCQMAMLALFTTAPRYV